MRTFCVTLMTAVFTLFTVMPVGWADSYHPDPYGYYSKYDHNGYYDKNGNYIHFSIGKRGDSSDRDWDEADPPPPPPRSHQVYSESEYINQCRKEREGSNVAGTIIGALAGGLIGGAASHHGGAVVGGVLLGGLVGNALTRNVPCDDHPVMIRTYQEGLDGPVGKRYDWRRGDDYGYFVPRREFRRDGYTCRSFRETTYVNGRKYSRSGTACRTGEGNWRFDD